MSDLNTLNAPQPACSGMAWTAVFAGALVAAAVSLTLLLLGSALGLSTVSPWGSNETVTSVTAMTAVWLIIMQWLSSALGGYLTGRLRSRWNHFTNDEVFFRDTAHGFLTWALATVITVVFLASTAGAVIGVGTRAAAAKAIAAPYTPNIDPIGYHLDELFRVNPPNPNVPSGASRDRAFRILFSRPVIGTTPEQDRVYLASIVAQETHISPEEARNRVNGVINTIRNQQFALQTEAEKARVVARNLSLIIFLSMIVGAFVASAAGALGGRHRDAY